MRGLALFLGRVFSGLRMRLLVLVALACAPLVVLTLHAAGEDRRRAMTALSQRSERMLQIARREEGEVIGTTRQFLFGVSGSTILRSLDAHRCRTWLNDLIKQYPRYSNLGVVTTNGQVLASAQPVRASEDPRDQNLFRHVLETRAFAIGELPPKDSDDTASVGFAHPVLDLNGDLLAIFFADLDLKWFDQSRSELPAQLPKGATWIEIAWNGSVLDRFPKPEEGAGGLEPDTSLISEAFRRSKGVIDALDPRGEPAFHAFGVVPSTLASGDVLGILSIPKSLLFADADRTLRWNLTWLGLTAALAMILGWIGSNFLILHPVKTLAKSTSRLAAGDLSARTGLPHSKDELGQLTRAFDQMAQALEQREFERNQANQKLQVLSRRLVEVQETERRHIARELHDEIGQSLTAAEMNLQAALQATQPGPLERRLAQSIQAVERVLEQVKDLSLNLRPSMLDDLGLEPALRWYANRQAELTGMQADFRADPLEARLDPVIESECFRVAQEALTNVVRHAHASVVSVEITRRDGELHLSVRDDGVGFDVETLRKEAVQGASLGLLSMEERASLAGGGFELISKPGQGTEVHAWFPLKWQKDDSSIMTDDLVQ